MNLARQGGAPAYGGLLPVGDRDCDSSNLERHPIIRRHACCPHTTLILLSPRPRACGAPVSQVASVVRGDPSQPAPAHARGHGKAAHALGSTSSSSTAPARSTAAGHSHSHSHGHSQARRSAASAGEPIAFPSLPAPSPPSVLPSLPVHEGRGLDRPSRSGSLASTSSSLAHRSSYYDDAEDDDGFYGEGGPRGSDPRGVRVRPDVFESRATVAAYTSVGPGTRARDKAGRGSSGALGRTVASSGTRVAFKAGTKGGSGTLGGGKGVGRVSAGARARRNSLLDDFGASNTFSAKYLDGSAMGA
jgi:hypothetical protein